MKNTMRACAGPGFLSEPLPCVRGGVEFSGKGRRLRCDECNAEHLRLVRAQAHQQKKQGEAPIGRMTVRALIKRAAAGALVMPDSSHWRCRGCGCTERVACPLGCSWVGKELCSSCATPEQHYIHKVAVDTNSLVALFNGVFKLPAAQKLNVKGREDAVELTMQRNAMRMAQGLAPSSKQFTLPGSKKRVKLDMDKMLTYIPRSKKRAATVEQLTAITGASPAQVTRLLVMLKKKKRVHWQRGKRRPGAQRGQAPLVYFK